VCMFVAAAAAAACVNINNAIITLGILFAAFLSLRSLFYYIVCVHCVDVWMRANERAGDEAMSVCVLAVNFKYFNFSCAAASTTSAAYYGDDNYYYSLAPCGCLFWCHLRLESSWRNLFKFDTKTLDCDAHFDCGTILHQFSSGASKYAPAVICARVRDAGIIMSKHSALLIAGLHNSIHTHHTHTLCFLVKN
jgi:hypothetical protein